MSSTSSKAQADSFFASDTPQITDEVDEATTLNGVPVSGSALGPSANNNEPNMLRFAHRNAVEDETCNWFVVFA